MARGKQLRSQRHASASIAGSPTGKQALLFAGQALEKVEARRYSDVQLGEAGRLSFSVRAAVVAREQSLLGTYFLLTNAAELGCEEIVKAYKQLQRVEAAFREMKDFLRVRPVYNWRQRRVEGHVFVCVLAYLLERVLEQRLEKGGVKLSARRALEELESVHAVKIELPDGELVAFTRPRGAAREVLRAVGIRSLPRVDDR